MRILSGAGILGKLTLRIGGKHTTMKTATPDALSDSHALARMEAGIAERLEAAATGEEVEAVRVEALGKKGSVTGLLKGLGGLPAEERARAGAALNALRERVEAAVSARGAEVKAREREAQLLRERADVGLPVSAGAAAEGRIHPLSEVGDELLAVFAAMGYEVEQGPDIESERYNFEALNIGAHHPARDMHDTFYLPGGGGADAPTLLRTHTSPVQIRAMERRQPPFRIIAPGRTYRRDSDQTHTPMFHQVEGLVVGPDIHMGHLKGALEQFLEMFFEVKAELRLRPSFFPFTEPSLEVDVRCARGGGEIRIGEGDDWLEILGCGMVHPKVLGNCGIDSREHQGFAFGIGIDRLAMLKYGIPDLRAFFDGDARWLRHYGFAPAHVPSLEGGLAPLAGT